MHENLVRIKAVAGFLKDLGQPVVFVGGATVSLYATKPVLAASIRPTDDVDVVIEILSYGGYAVIEDRLREIGFENDQESGIICRYKIQGIIVDIMPTDESVLNFNNKWYPDGYKNAIEFTLDDGTAIFIFSLPYFLASKWDAHKDRGAGDLRTSQDFEDMVYVFENCKDVFEQLSAGSKEILAYFREEWKSLIDTPDFEEGVYAHMETGAYGGNPQSIIQPLKNTLRL